jgi:hypothetical protein
LDPNISARFTPTESADYSLWKTAKKKIKKPSPPRRTSQETWSGSNVEKAHVFAEHLAKICHPNPLENESKEEEALTQLLETPYQLESPINCLKRAKLHEDVNNLNTKK